MPRRGSGVGVEVEFSPSENEALGSMPGVTNVFLVQFTRHSIWTLASLHVCFSLCLSFPPAQLATIPYIFFLPVSYVSCTEWSLCVCSAVSLYWSQANSIKLARALRVKWKLSGDATGNWAATFLEAWALLGSISESWSSKTRNSLHLYSAENKSL